MTWQPRWLKPTWLRWLEDNYGSAIDLMFEEVRQMGVDNWEAQVKTQTDLERWADNLAHMPGFSSNKT